MGRRERSRNSCASGVATQETLFEWKAGKVRIFMGPDRSGEGCDFRLISHRGGRGFGPENSLQALQAALESGVEMVETDVRMTADGVPVIHHGPFLGMRLISRISIAELRETDSLVPTLREYLEVAAGRIALNLEVKRCDPYVLADLLREFDLPEPPLVSSFDDAFLSEFRRTGYPACLGLLDQYDPVRDRLFRKARECGASVILPLYLGVDRELVAAARKEGLRVITWTVNSPSALRTLIDWGVEGVITDDYPRLRSFLEENYKAAGVPPAAGTLLPGREAFRD